MKELDQLLESQNSDEFIAAYHCFGDKATNILNSIDQPYKDITHWHTDNFHSGKRGALFVFTDNAVRIQISSAIIAYCLVAIVQHDLQLKRSTYEVLQILSISLMDKIPLVDLFERTDFNNVKELDCPLFPGLFD